LPEANSYGGSFYLVPGWYLDVIAGDFGWCTKYGMLQVGFHRVLTIPIYIYGKWNMTSFDRMEYGKNM
jgi:hypothetical protein